MENSTPSVTAAWSLSFDDLLGVRSSPDPGLPRASRPKTHRTLYAHGGRPFRRAMVGGMHHQVDSETACDGAVKWIVRDLGSDVSRRRTTITSTPNATYMISTRPEKAASEVYHMFDFVAKYAASSPLGLLACHRI